MIRALTHHEILSPEFWHLLWRSCESDDDTRHRVRRDILTELSTIGAVDSDTDDRDVVVGFATYQLTERGVTIEYIATSEAAQGQGVGTQLVRALQRLYPGAVIFAQTDDDAIGFYRALGFVDAPAPRDARWPERQRYDCALHPSSRIHKPLDLGTDRS